MNDDQKCMTGPTKLFPNTPQCANTGAVWVFGHLYCQECADRVRSAHSKFTSVGTRELQKK